MLMTSCFVCATLILGRKKSTGTEPSEGDKNSTSLLDACLQRCLYTYGLHNTLHFFKVENQLIFIYS